MARAIVLPNRVIDRIEREARSRGLTIEEYLVELLSVDLDPRDRAREYIEVAKEMVEQTKEELNRGDIRRAAEKLWSATALAIRAYAM